MPQHVVGGHRVTLWGFFLFSSVLMWLPRMGLRLHGLCSKHFTYLVHPVAPLFIILRQSISKFPTLELSILLPQPPQGLELQVCATRPRFKL